MAKSNLQNINIEDLSLDTHNPRFGELYVGNNTEEDLINYLLYNESGVEVAKNIVSAGEFYLDRPLWVIQKGEKYLVKDGNRRCAAIKALETPGIYELDLPRTSYKQLPALVYNDEESLNKRIFLEHANSTFRSWERIAKALEVYKLFKSDGASLQNLSEIDSQPGQLIKLASFYKSAVEFGENNLRRLLTRGRGKTGGRTIIFERLFKYSQKCGYKFKNSPSFEIVVEDIETFKKYIVALVKLLESDAEYQIKTDVIDSEKESFMKRLKPFGFDYFYVPIEKNTPPTSTPSDTSNGNSTGINTGNQNNGVENTEMNNPSSADNTVQASSSDNNTNGNSPAAKPAGTPRPSFKTRPRLRRKGIPAGIKNRINECYDLNSTSNCIAKLALVRITYECTLKYIVEHTTYGSKSNKLSNSNHFQSAFKNKQGIKLPSTNFDELEKQFIKLIKDNGIKRTFETFNLDHLQQIIHNYNVVGIPQNATSYADQLIPLLEFMLAENKVFLDSIELSNIS
ncbi:hypothetical protein GCM10008015_26650 [Flavobacterium palustre]|uniref:ParB/Sulfiredoxin domain-containing protein n=1 Tax=Flavobacterium palustre TaxID=1476463 RepID=A0ABQ1HQ46_9FLAO|nr:hypothetical protein [Flavobacterium palustre]GGA84530.1 hypothetical protein GCM10008015_26650 [Flavobacterium palustre]